MIKIFAGEDKKIYLTLSLDGELVDLNDFSKVKCFLVDSINTVKASFSREALQSYIKMDQQGNNVLVINLKREITKDLARDNYKFEILTKKEDNDFSEDFKSIGIVNAFQVVKPSTDAINI